MELGISIVWRETFLSSLDMARELLKGLGWDRKSILYEKYD